MLEIYKTIPVIYQTIRDIHRCIFCVWNQVLESPLDKNLRMQTRYTQDCMDTRQLYTNRTQLYTDRTQLYTDRTQIYTDRTLYTSGIFGVANQMYAEALPSCLAGI